MTCPVTGTSSGVCLAWRRAAPSPHPCPQRALKMLLADDDNANITANNERVIINGPKHTYFGKWGIIIDTDGAADAVRSPFPDHGYRPVMKCPWNRVFKDEMSERLVNGGG